MTVREMVLFAILVGLGIHSFRQEHAWTRRRLAFLRARQRSAAGEVRRLRQHQRNLRAEEVALDSDCYYVERMAREQLGWRPIMQPSLVPSPVDLPTLGLEPGELAMGLPSLAPAIPAPAGPPATSSAPATTRAPAPPAPAPQRQPDRDRRLLAALGYTSVKHFQGKMMRGRATGALDAATRRRAREIRVRLARLGYASVREFQQRHRLKADGIYGKRTEQRVLAELRRQRHQRARASGVVAESNGGPRQPGG